MTDYEETPNPVEFEITHDQGYALANLLSFLTADLIGNFAEDEREAGNMLSALSALKQSLEFVGYYPSEDTESRNA